MPLVIPRPPKVPDIMVQVSPAFSWDERMEKKMEATIMGYVGTTIRIHSFTPRQPTVRHSTDKKPVSPHVFEARVNHMPATFPPGKGVRNLQPFPALSIQDLSWFQFRALPLAPANLPPQRFGHGIVPILEGS